MATVRREGNKLRVCCDIPRCLKKRAARNQPNGRFLFTAEFEESAAPETRVNITMACPECGGSHAVTIQKPLPVA